MTDSTAHDQNPVPFRHRDLHHARPCGGTETTGRQIVPAVSQGSTETGSVVARSSGFVACSALLSVSGPQEAGASRSPDSPGWGARLFVPAPVPAAWTARRQPDRGALSGSQRPATLLDPAASFGVPVARHSSPWAGLTARGVGSGPRDVKPSRRKAARHRRVNLKLAVRAARRPALQGCLPRGNLLAGTPNGGASAAAGGRRASAEQLVEHVHGGIDYRFEGARRHLGPVGAVGVGFVAAPLVGFARG